MRQAHVSRLLASLLGAALAISACSSSGQVAAATPTPTPLPSATGTEVPASTTPSHTPTETASPTATQPPTETPAPTATLPVPVWLDDVSHQLMVHHPADSQQSEWGTSDGLVYEIDAQVGGVVFQVESVNGQWGPARSDLVSASDSLFAGATMLALEPGMYCVADFFQGLGPDQVCRHVAPQATPLRWITPYFAGPKERVGVAFNAGGCSPTDCTVDLVISELRVILFADAHPQP